MSVPTPPSPATAPAPTLLKIPIRVDATLCAPGEIWFEGPKGDAVRIWPPPQVLSCR